MSSPAVLSERQTRPLKRAWELVDSALDTLSHRNKMVKLADLSEVGWAVVDEYESHQLASDSGGRETNFQSGSESQQEITRSQVKTGIKLPS